MKLVIDQNNILVIDNTNIPKTKKYCHNISGFDFCDFDKGIIIYHKKQFKIINLKDLGDKMGVIMVGEKDNELDDLKLCIESMENALKLFEGFNEENGEKYYFLYKFTESKLEELNMKLKLLGSDINIKKTTKGICCDYKDEELSYDPASFLFGLALIYGDFNIKNNDLKSIKIQIPLFGKYKENIDIIKEVIGTLNDNGIFLKTNIQESSDGIIYQINSSDFELLQIFARFYEPIEKGLQISKYTDTLKIKEELLEFLKTNNDIPVEGKSIVLKEIEKGMMKILLK